MTVRDCISVYQCFISPTVSVCWQNVGIRDCSHHSHVGAWCSVLSNQLANQQSASQRLLSKHEVVMIVEIHHFNAWIFYQLNFDSPVWFQHWLPVAAIDKTWNGYFRYTVTKQRFISLQCFLVFSVKHWISPEQSRASQWMSVQKNRGLSYFVILWRLWLNGSGIKPRKSRAPSYRQFTAWRAGREGGP